MSDRIREQFERGLRYIKERYGDGPKETPPAPPGGPQPVPPPPPPQPYPV